MGRGASDGGFWVTVSWIALAQHEACFLEVFLERLSRSIVRAVGIQCNNA